MRPTANGEVATLDTLRLSATATQSILDRFDEAGADPAGAEQRAAPRRGYRTNTGLVVTVYHPGGSNIRYAVTPRNISSTGVGFLHGSFLHKDTNCVVSLPTLTGQWVNAVGKVVRCQHMEGKIHEIGVLFRSPIQPEQFVVAEGDATPANDGSDLPKLIGKVLCVEDSVDDRDLVRFMLARLDVKVLMINAAEEALAMFEGGVPFDLLLITHRPGTLDGLGTVKALRDNGCEQPTVLVTADESAQLRTDAAAHGCDAVLAKPFDHNGLANVLLQHLPLAEAEIEDTNTSVLQSSLWQDEAMRPLILVYLENLAAHVQQLEGALIAAGQTQTVDAICLQIKGSAGGYGYPQISHAAQHLLALNRAMESPEKLQRNFHALVRLCQRACRAAEPGQRKS